MASQHVIFAETIAAMKKARKRRAYESDSDSEVDYHGNRGHKLKRRARFTHEGQLVAPSGPEVYKEIVNHAGYQRAIISRNPPLIDDEGYEIDSDDDEEQILDAMNNAAEFNPYTNIRLENVLAPLTAVTDLPTHQTLSRPYTSKTLTELTKQGCSLMHKENAALWKIKHLQTKLVGDHNWVPCELMIGPNDIELFNDDYVDRSQESLKSDSNTLMLEHTHTHSEAKSNGHSATNGDGQLKSPHTTRHDPSKLDKPGILMTDADPTPNEAATAQDPRFGKHKINQASSSGNKDLEHTDSRAKEADTQSQQNGQVINQKEKHVAEALMADWQTVNGSTVSTNSDKARVQTSQLNEAARKTVNDMSRPVSAISDSTSDLPIHPMFIPPRSARPDRDLGIPESEAEDMRRIFQLFVQKQEEVCRGVKRLYEGLLRAERMRKTVLQWSKYEAHVGPNRDMSDGEDWYDKEEWGFDEDLKKGQDEEEDEPQTTKKTRTRR
ncbi:RXT2-like protein [Xylaria bambusicola]|uniref:RXT2-like protein n=1 Tax=Xylaria bambusicola TaxID=326684 RepID=UPI0020078053|nr:RXT2-like protein [Xylaria bambusicola]KAI0515026.1 RXT2-like protein [Xylaria bambusicola]